MEKPRDVWLLHKLLVLYQRVALCNSVVMQATKAISETITRCSVGSVFALVSRQRESRYKSSLRSPSALKQHVTLETTTLEPLRRFGPMTFSTESKVWTDEEFMALSKDGHRYELVNGKPIDMGNSGMEHGGIGSFLGGLLAIYVRREKLGIVCDSSTAFALNNGNKRSPDVSFVDRERLKGLKSPPRGFFQGSPDLAVEILSPSNTVEEIHQKIVEYFENGTRLVWVIHPDERYVLVYHSPEPDRFLRPDNTLDGEDVVPGFSMAVAELFEVWDF